ncbi:MAG: hypothetical protein AMJ79_12825 [Phycisphaerae bacterium SM23_30]|nr:MAG: hypothetical protein AMJ79_12825 [Phycisphaerae bacterium SM23_30]
MDKESYLVGYLYDRLSFPHKSQYLTYSYSFSNNKSFLLSSLSPIPAHSILEDFFLSITFYLTEPGSLSFGLSPLPTITNFADVDFSHLAPGLYFADDKPLPISFFSPFVIDIHNLNHYIGDEDMYIHFSIIFDVPVFIIFNFRLKYSVPQSFIINQLEMLTQEIN